MEYNRKLWITLIGVVCFGAAVYYYNSQSTNLVDPLSNEAQVIEITEDMAPEVPLVEAVDIKITVSNTTTSQRITNNVCADRIKNELQPQLSPKKGKRLFETLTSFHKQSDLSDLEKLYVNYQLDIPISEIGEYGLKHINTNLSLSQLKENAFEIYDSFTLVGAIQEHDEYRFRQIIQNWSRLSNSDAWILGQTKESLLVSFWVLKKDGFFPNYSELELLQLFLDAGYPVNIFDLIRFSSFAFYDDKKFYSTLGDAYRGNIDSVFIYKQNKHSNLGYIAIEHLNYQVAEYWFNRGVNPYVNLNFVKESALQASVWLQNAEEGDNKSSLIRLLQKGIFNVDGVQLFYDFLGQQFSDDEQTLFFPKRTRKSTVLSAESEQLANSIVKEINAQQRNIFNEIVDGSNPIPEQCLAKFQKLLNKSFFKDLNMPTGYKAPVNKEGEQETLSLVINASGSFKNGATDSSSLVSELSGIDHLSAKRTLYYHQELQGYRQMSMLSETLLSISNSRRDSLLFVDFGDYERALLTIKNSQLDKEVKASLSLYIATINNRPISEAKLFIEEVKEITFEHMVAALIIDSPEHLDLMINSKERLNTIDEYGNSLLTKSLNLLASDSFKWLLNQGINIELPETGFDALDHALVDVSDGYPSMMFVQYLLDNGKNVEHSHKQLFEEIAKFSPSSVEQVAKKYSILEQ